MNTKDINEVLQAAGCKQTNAVEDRVIVRARSAQQGKNRAALANKALRPHGLTVKYIREATGHIGYWQGVDCPELTIRLRVLSAS